MPCPPPGIGVALASSSFAFFAGGELLAAAGAGVAAGRLKMLPRMLACASH
ncbi:MAG: hypothetical protein H0X40_18715 [Chthoniobacterales bacterium]|nr:hypothetical protein [Chthoniobacterales bacterium]